MTNFEKQSKTVDKKLADETSDLETIEKTFNYHY